MFSFKTRIIALAAGCALALTGTGTALAGGSAKLTIKGRNGDFSGTVKTKKRSCADKRTVTVYMQQGSEQDPSVDSEIGSDTSELHGKHGEWSTGNSGYKEGNFYARASKEHGCKALSSKTIHETAVE